jgi:5-methyltetrahydropteroyltriglutamate--homocysteine methyltransferase
MSTEPELRELRAEHIGSLVHPDRLRDVFLRYDRGEATEEELLRAQDEAIREVVRKQEAMGLPVVGDGELRRHNFQESFSACVSGFDVPREATRFYRHENVNKTPLERAEQDFDAAGPAVITRRKAVARLDLVRNLPLEEYRFASNAAARPVKPTLLGPDRIAQRFKWEDSRSVYPGGLDEFVEDVVRIERSMIADLVAAGCRYIQIDAPGYTAYVDQVSLDRMRSRGEDTDENLERSIQADNALIDGFPGVTFGIHLCRGNARTLDPATGELVPQWHREGHYDAIAERLFTGLRHHRFLLEYDSDRAGSFESLRFVPADKTVVLGLVTTKSARVESVDELRNRVDEASRYCPLEQLALSPQCGFGGLYSERLSEDDQWRKLKRILETASAIWGSR